VYRIYDNDGHEMLVKSTGAWVYIDIGYSGFYMLMGNLKDPKYSKSKAIRILFG